MQNRIRPSSYFELFQKSHRELACACNIGPAALLQMWMPPAGVREVLIAGDNDPSYTGQSAAFTLAKRLVREGYAVEVNIPVLAGKDWADEGL